MGRGCQPRARPCALQGVGRSASAHGDLSGTSGGAASAVYHHVICSRLRNVVCQRRLRYPFRPCARSTQTSPSLLPLAPPPPPRFPRPLRFSSFIVFRLSSSPSPVPLVVIRLVYTRATYFPCAPLCFVLCCASSPPLVFSCCFLFPCVPIVPVPVFPCPRCPCPPCPCLPPLFLSSPAPTPSTRPRSFPIPVPPSFPFLLPLPSPLVPSFPHSVGCSVSSLPQSLILLSPCSRPLLSPLVPSPRRLFRSPLPPDDRTILSPTRDVASTVPSKMTATTMIMVVLERPYGRCRRP